jgi:hypothetical protein
VSGDGRRDAVEPGKAAPQRTARASKARRIAASPCDGGSMRMALSRSKTSFLLALISIALVAACHGGRAGGDQPDANLVPAVDAPPSSGTCDPFAQTGCGSGQKCAWERTVVSATAQHGQFACVPAGPKQAGAACTFGAAGATGFDDCAAGLECLADVTTDQASGTCRTICSLNAASNCASGTACVKETKYFDDQFSSYFGLCAPTCDPLTNQRSDGAARCGGTTDANGVATQTCVGLPDTVSVFTCAPTRNPTRTSDAPAYEPGLGGAYLDGCAPGFLPLLYKDTPSGIAGDEMAIICVAYCEPGATSKEAPANAAGKVGSDDTCPKKGAAGTHECRYWWFFETDSKPTSKYSNGLGYCFDYAKYQYDPTAKGAPPTMQDPSCTTLSSTAHTFDPLITDDIFWGCGPITGHAIAGHHAAAPYVLPLPR